MLGLKEFGMTSPAYGVKKNTPGILLAEAFLSDSQDVCFQDKELTRIRKREDEFPNVDDLPDAILAKDYYYKAASQTGWLMVMTARDIAYRDSGNDCWAFLNKTYAEGLITEVEELSGDRLLLTIEGSGVDLSENVAEGDFIQLSDAETKDTTIDWYEVEEVLTGNQLIISGTFPSGFEVGEGHAYLIRRQYGAGDNGQWSFTTMQDYWVVTNDVDLIQYWDGLGGETQDLTDCPYRARVVYNFDNRLIIGNLTLRATETAYPFAYGWSGIDDILDWAEEIWQLLANRELTFRDDWSAGDDYVINNAVLNDGVYYTCIAANTDTEPPNASYWEVLSFDELNWTGDWSEAETYAVNDVAIYNYETYLCVTVNVDKTPGASSDSGMKHAYIGTGELIGFGGNSGFLYALKEQCAIRVQDSGDQDVFVQTLDIPELGTRAMASIVCTDKAMYWLANDNTFIEFNGITHPVISDNIKKIVDNINPENAWRTQGYWSKELNWVIWAIPYMDSEGLDEGLNEPLNRILIYDIERGSWLVSEMDLTCIGEYLRESGINTYEELDTVLGYKAYVDWNWPRYESSQSLQDAPIVIVGGYDGRVYEMFAAELDNGAEYEGYAVIETDFSVGKKKLTGYKKLHYVWVIARSGGEDDTLGLKVRKGSESKWHDAGEKSLAGTSEFVTLKYNVNRRAKHFGIKLYGSNAFSIVAIFYFYKPDGD